MEIQVLVDHPVAVAKDVDGSPLEILHEHRVRDLIWNMTETGTNPNFTQITGPGQARIRSGVAIRMPR